MNMFEIESRRPFNILLVEDNPGDVRLTQEAFKESKFFYKMYVVNDGEEALEFLYKKQKFQNVPIPDVILLDLNLPKIHGTEVLKEIKNDPELKIIPVIILTTSEADEDILKTYQLHANSYITKPVEFQKFLNVVRKVEEYWLSIVKLPRRKSNV
ncbi:MAG: response regulator [Candidatus Thorarchaeota archaeon]